MEDADPASSTTTPGCHLQWYLEETAEVFVHGLCQALMKRGLPRSLLTDNGSPMLAGEVEEGLHRHPALPHARGASPYERQVRSLVGRGGG